tara:strand:+ start:1726 stop:2010 length:285 start_codon:yes stop_codon:yes gene_type:complete
MSESTRYRMVLSKSIKNLSVQILDENSGHTLASGNTLKYDKGGDIKAAEKLGKEIAEAAKKNNISLVWLDRGNNRYTGRVLAFAESARKNGLKF